MRTRATAQEAVKAARALLPPVTDVASKSRRIQLRLLYAQKEDEKGWPKAEKDKNLTRLRVEVVEHIVQSNKRTMCSNVYSSQSKKNETA